MVKAKVKPGTMFDNYTQKTYSCNQLPLKSDKPPLGPKKSLNTVNTSIEPSEIYNDFGSSSQTKHSSSYIVDGVPLKLLKQLYEAKCKDLTIPTSAD